MTLHECATKVTSGRELRVLLLKEAGPAWIDGHWAHSLSFHIGRSAIFEPIRVPAVRPISF